MSLILDALNRSARERERSIDSPGLATVTEVDRLEGPALWHRAIPWVGLGIALVVIVALFYDRLGEAPETNPIASPAPVVRPVIATEPRVAKPRASAVKKPSVLPPPAVVPVPESAASVDTGVHSSVAALYGASSSSSAPDTITEPQEKAAVTHVEEPVKPAARPAAPPVAERRDEQTGDKEINIEDLLERTKAEMGNRELSQHSAPFITALSQQEKNDIPSLLYSKHDYSSGGPQSSVVINGKAVRAGGSPAAGVKVDEILADSVVLSFRGTQFRLRALNSWVNL